jgi:oxygen-dependent protoporphyrinogen oxidase
MDKLDLLVLGAGVAGLTAAYRLRHLDLEVVEAEDFVGGRMKSKYYGPGVWGNHGAQGILSDRVRTTNLALELGLELAQDEALHNYWEANLPTDSRVRAEIVRVAARLEAEQRNRRPATDPELDDRTFGEWLGEVDPEVALYFERVNYASGAMISLYGAMMQWGDQRVTAWADDVERTSVGDVYVVGGTGRIGDRLAQEIDNRVSLSTRAVALRRVAGGSEVDIVSPNGERTVRARQVICAVPAPSAAEIGTELPEWKLAALRTVRYTKWIGTSILIAPLTAAPPSFTFTHSRPGVRYDATGFLFRTPGNFDTQGGCISAFMTEDSAGQVWEDPDHSIATGVAEALLRQEPELRGRIERVDIKRWPFALPLFYPGRMKRWNELLARVENVSFCGDYTSTGYMEGAIESGERAAREVAASLVESGPAKNRADAGKKARTRT